VPNKERCDRALFDWWMQTFSKYGRRDRNFVLQEEHPCLGFDVERISGLRNKVSGLNAEIRDAVALYAETWPRIRKTTRKEGSAQDG